MKNKRKIGKPCGCTNNEYYAKDRKCLLGRTFLSKIKFTKIAVVFLLIIQICLSIAISSKSNIIDVSQATKWQSTGKSAVNQTPGKTSKAYENKQAIKIVAEKPQWSNETASVKLQIIGDLSDMTTLQYSIKGTDDWKPYKSGEENIIIGLKHKQAIAVKMYNESTKVTKTSYIYVKDEKEPQKATTTLTNYETTAKSVMNVPVVQTDNESGIDIEKCKWVYNTTETPIGTNEADYTGGSFVSNPQTIQVECNTAGNYYVHVLSVDKAGNKTETVFNPIKVSIGAATEELKQGNIIATAPIWNNGKAEITLNTHTGLNIQWQKNTINGTWQAGNTITDLQHGDSVFARLVDDNGNIGQHASVSILDGNAPNTAEISLSATQTYEGTAITATVTHSDNESGIDIEKCKWVYNTTSTKIGTIEANYTGGNFSSNEQEISLTANTEGTYYLHILSVDKAGNKVETISSGVTVELAIYWATSEDGIEVPVPIGFVPSTINGEKKVEEGFVIKQGDNGAATEGINEFVWVPVPNPAEMFTVDNEGNPAGQLYDFGTSSSPKNPAEKIAYPTTKNSDNREPDVVTASESWDAASTNLSILGLNNDKEFKTQLQNEFNSMKESVERYKGFYIGRYETGNLSKEKAVVQKNNSDINAQNWYIMYQKSKGIVEGTKAQSTMIWGCQWDACLRWMQTSSNEDVKNFVTNSGGKGNYSRSRIPTGSNDRYKVNNIYDMAGNVYDRTIEAYGLNGRVCRGGGYYDKGYDNPVSDRYGFFRPDIAGGEVGARLALYL